MIDLGPEFVAVANMRKRPPDYTGRRFGRFTVLGRIDTHRLVWLCRCDCGNLLSYSRPTQLRADASCRGRSLLPYVLDAIYAEFPELAAK